MKPLPKLEEMTDILDLKDIQIWDLRWFWILLGSLAFILVVWVIYRWWMKRRTGKALPSIPKTPLQNALDRLEELANSRLAETGEIQKFYFNLSDIFREFIERELKISALETTLEELRPQIKKCQDLSSEEVTQALWLLELADLAKFAKFVPAREDIIQSMRVCRLWMHAVAERRQQKLQTSLKAGEVAS